jgi:hypothetical protein
MTAFTRLGADLWTWEPWVSLRNPEAQLLWLGLYTTSSARRNAPGLWQGGIPVMAEASNMQPDAVISGLDRLISAELVEYDPKYRVLRLCALPDPGEYPANGNGIRSWWTRFGTVPECGVRDAHVTTLRWILDEGARRGRKKVSPQHEAAWEETFARVHVPASRRRGVRTLLNSDTGTHAQPSLFAAPSVPLILGNGSSEGSYPHDPQGSVDNSAALHQLNKNNGPETVTGTVTATNRIPDLGSRISSSGEGEGGRGARPVLALVPPYTAEEVLVVMAKGNWDPAFDRTRQNALSALIPAWVAERVGLEDLALLADYSRMESVRMSVRWLLGCDIGAEISKARRVLEWRDARAKAMAESLP